MVLQLCLNYIWKSLHSVGNVSSSHAQNTYHLGRPNCQKYHHTRRDESNTDALSKLIQLGAIQHDIFQRFKPLEADRNQFTGAEGSETWFSYQAWVMRVFAETLNTTQTWVREDYREMCELLIARTCEALQSQ